MADLEADLPGFSNPPAREPDDPAMLHQAEATEPSPGEPAGGGDAPEIPSSPATAKLSPASIDLAVGFFVDVITLAFGFVGKILHVRFTPGDDQAIWIPTEQEERDVAGPLAKIAARHAPIGEAVAGDVGDAIAAGVAATAYAASNLTNQSSYRAWLASGAAGASQQAEQNAPA